MRTPARYRCPSDTTRSADPRQRSALPPTRPRVIIRVEPLDGAPIDSPDPIGCGSLPHASGRSLPAMIDHEPAIDRPPAPDDHATSLTQLLADLRSGKREAFDQILPLVYDELRRAARRELA